jgi:uncharacterized RDD family membrane protein YckC
MVIFAATAMLVVVIAGLELLLVTDGATRDSDPAIYAFLAIIGLGTPLAWSALNLLILMTRRQTAGHYVAGIRLAREDGAEPRRRDLLTWWFCLNPALFSWPMAVVTGLPLAFVISLLLQRATLAFFGTLIVLCVVAPVVALIAAATDGRRRGLHDRVAGTIVVPAG